MAGGCYGRGSYWKKLWAFWALVLEQAMNSSLGVTDWPVAGDSLSESRWAGSGGGLNLGPDQISEQVSIAHL